MTTGYKICTRCVMDTTDPEIQFDENGICNHCKRYRQREATEVYYHQQGQEKWKRLVEQIKREGKNKKYDCLVGVSGGVDSTYVAYKAKELGLRPLALHLDNGWDSELAVSNIEKVLKNLGIDLLTHVLEWEEFKDLQLSFLKASLLDLEIPSDHAILAYQYKVAASKGISYILSGRNVATEGSLPKKWNFDAKDLKHLKVIHRRFGSKKLKSYPKLGYTRLAYYTFIKRIRSIPILNYIPYVKKDAMAILQDQLGWKYYGGKHHESIYTRFFQTIYLPEKFNIDKRKAHLSGLVWSGQLAREEALEELKTGTYSREVLEEDREYVMKKLGLTTGAFEELMALPTKDHLEFPNTQNFMDKIKFFIRYARKKAISNID
ncbi:MAG: N-acetyl sugar amidotransferase [bacterium]|nr:N-acetyl sugar amidotransferase [bacterium]